VLLRSRQAKRALDGSQRTVAGLGFVPSQFTSHSISTPLILLRLQASPLSPTSLGILPIYQEEESIDGLSKTLRRSHEAESEIHGTTIRRADRVPSSRREWPLAVECKRGQMISTNSGS